MKTDDATATTMQMRFRVSLRCPRSLSSSYSPLGTLMNVQCTVLYVLHTKTLRHSRWSGGEEEELRRISIEATRRRARTTLPLVSAWRSNDDLND